MGSLFSKLRASSISKVVLDFETPVSKESLSPTARKAYDSIEGCCVSMDKALAQLAGYKDLKPTMKVVMDTRRVDEHKQALIEAMPTIKRIQQFYHLAEQLNTEIPKLLDFIKSENLKDQEALCQIFTRLIDKTRKWDALKCQRPGILNDFSFYRRNFAKMVQFDITFPVSEQEANVISMFLAQPCPLTMAMAKKLKDARDERACMVFANIANALCRGVTEEFQRKETLDYACSAMAGAVVIFDHAMGMGVFGSNAIKMKAIAEALTGYGETGENLLYYMKYNIRNFTSLCPSKIAALFP